LSAVVVSKSINTFVRLDLVSVAVVVGEVGEGTLLLVGVRAAPCAKSFIIIIIGVDKARGVSVLVGLGDAGVGAVAERVEDVRVIAVGGRHGDQVA